ncbi:phospholipase D-like domain-containing protein, partial [Weissella confusa]
MFREIAENIQPVYTSTIDNVTEDFYNKVLAESVTYNRVSGFFSSKALSMYATGLDKLAKNNGRVRFIISKSISEEDFNSIQSGYELRDSDDLSEIDKIHLGNLAYLIAEGKADVKFGLVKNGLFHAKWGYFEDEEENSIYFNGSNNETLQAVQYNFESFNVDLSWDSSPFVKQRIAIAKKEFEQLWMDDYPGVKVVDATSLIYDMLSEYDKGGLQSEPTGMDDALVLDFFDDGGLHFIDDTDIQIASLKTFKRKFEYYVDEEKGMPFLRAGLTYREVEDIAEKAQTQAKRKNVPFVISSRLQNWLDRERYSIEEYRKAGLTIKDDDERWTEEEIKFAQVVNEEVARPLKQMQMKSAFYMYTQKRAANFSVPGSGKTAMLLGVFAYLNRKSNPVVDRILVISPINAFMSWRDEFNAVFEEKKALRYMTVHDEDVANNPLAFQSKWVDSNLVMVNYESLPKMK